VEEKYILDKIRDPQTSGYGFNLLVTTYQQKVYWVVRKIVINHHDADDLTQEIFIKVYKSITNFKENSKLFTWIYRIAVNESLTFIKKKRLASFFSLEDVNSNFLVQLDSSPLIEGDEIQRLLQKAVLKLPTKQRIIFTLKYFEELSYNEIAEITGTSEGALKASYHHAVKKITNILSKD